ncbi:MAG: energy-coupling factor transporter transmembrane protein EcfT [Spirochaetaceae bacterium]|jgi:energy-coupling factor transport system permease protein|nr:energy-coupling factor transporter transmembrane protein EcfT [Spirochaetaceae bacterium]
MKHFMLQYQEGASPVHRLNGAIRFIVFLLWSILAMIGYNTFILLGLGVLGIVLFAVSGVHFRDVGFIFKMLIVFMVLNLLAIYLFAPEQGVEIYGTRHLLAEGAGRWTITAEQLFYEFNVFIKYVTIVPPAILLMVTTNPSEFASSLNRIGVPYTAAYAVALTLRYIPDVQRDFQIISHAQQARGLELSKKASILKRLKGAARLLLPLVIISMERIDIVSHAMELRGFGKNKKRTWYMYKPFTPYDIGVLITAIVVFVVCIVITFLNGSRYYNPFM